jgi:hypothetical protein
LPDGLTADAQSFSAGSQDVQPGTSLQQLLGQLGARGYHVFAVIQHQQQIFVFQEFAEV